ncbi:EFR1 family ferrodoxin [Anaerosporobacter sp.]
MILYFSATGNNKYVAEELAKRTNDRTVSILDCMRQNLFQIELAEGENLGFVLPTYFWGLPTVVMEYFRKFKMSEGKHYTYFIASYGTSPGGSHIFAEKALGDSNVKFNAYYSICMPDTWTPEFDLSKADEVKAINDAEVAQIEQMSEKISCHAEGNFMQKKKSYFASKLTYTVYDKIARKTRHFHVEDSCIGCGLCEQKCPVCAIEMRDGKPVWVQDKCVMCLGCLHRCPKFAIQYSTKTQKHGQYKHPGVSL